MHATVLSDAVSPTGEIGRSPLPPGGPPLSPGHEGGQDSGRCSAGPVDAESAAVRGHLLLWWWGPRLLLLSRSG